jgi:hypothetical protein
MQTGLVSLHLTGDKLLLVAVDGNAPTYHAYHACALLLSYTAIVVSAGLEPTTQRLRAACSTIEPRNQD